MFEIDKNIFPDDHVWPREGLEKRLYHRGAWPGTKMDAFVMSIVKWRILVDEPVGDGDASTCGLCKLYLWHDCDGCPVKEATGAPWCSGTPYIEYEDAKTDEAAKDAALRELLFLTGLLAKEYEFRVEEDVLLYEGPQPKTMLEALVLSIAKWRVLVDTPVDDDGGPTTCGLCGLYFKQDCWGCPVSKATGRAWCMDTPYTEYIYYPDQNRLKDIALAELLFLTKLLVKEA